MAADKDLAYSPSHFATGFAATLARQREAGRSLVRRHAPPLIGAGADHATRFHLFVPNGQGPWPLVVFIHGGYWQELGAADTDFLAQRYLDRGMAFASIGYGLAPHTSIETMIKQCTEGLQTAYHALAQHGGVWSVQLSGHSAGAQLAYWVAARNAVPIDKLLLVSGVYDLTPLVDTYVNAPLRLNGERARRLSPQFDNLSGLPRCKVVVAENDPPAFREQASAFIAALRQTNVPAEWVDLPGCDHFSVLDKL